MMTETMFKVALLRAGMTQHQLALRLGLHPSTVSRIVAGMFVPPPEIQTAFRAALGEHGEGLQFGYRLKDAGDMETNKTTVVETENTCPIRAAEEEK